MNELIVHSVIQSVYQSVNQSVISFVTIHTSSFMDLYGENSQQGDRDERAALYPLSLPEARIKRCSFFSLSHLVIPSYPRDVVTRFVNQSSATITWLPPAITGDQVFYEVECGRTCEVDSKACTEEICGGDENTLFEFINKTSGRTGLLSPFVNYTCKIMARNRVSDVAARKHKVEASSTTITFKTNGSGK